MILFCYGILSKKNGEKVIDEKYRDFSNALIVSLCMFNDAAK